MKILVTGSEGQLGSDLLKILPERHEVLGCDIQDWDITDLPIALENVEKIRLSTTSKIGVKDRID